MGNKECSTGIIIGPALNQKSRASLPYFSGPWNERKPVVGASFIDAGDTYCFGIELQY